MQSCWKLPAAAGRHHSVATHLVQAQQLKFNVLILSDLPACFQSWDMLRKALASSKPAPIRIKWIYEFNEGWLTPSQKAAIQDVYIPETNAVFQHFIQVSAAAREGCKQYFLFTGSYELPCSASMGGHALHSRGHCSASMGGHALHSRGHLVYVFVRHLFTQCVSQSHVTQCHYNTPCVMSATRCGCLPQSP